MDNEKIQVINLAEYKAPIVNESTREDWVEYGEDNNYFQYLYNYRKLFKLIYCYFFYYIMQ
jgi:hypothetical protein